MFFFDTMAWDDLNKTNWPWSGVESTSFPLQISGATSKTAWLKSDEDLTGATNRDRRALWICLDLFLVHHKVVIIKW